MIKGSLNAYGLDTPQPPDLDLIVMIKNTAETITLIIETVRKTSTRLLERP